MRSRSGRTRLAPSRSVRSRRAPARRDRGTASQAPALRVRDAIGNQGMQERAAGCPCLSRCPTGGMCDPCPYAEGAANRRAAHDPFEREADHAAAAFTQTPEHASSMPEPFPAMRAGLRIQKMCAECAEAEAVEPELEIPERPAPSIESPTVAPEEPAAVVGPNRSTPQPESTLPTSPTPEASVAPPEESPVPAPSHEEAGPSRGTPGADEVAPESVAAPSGPQPSTAEPGSTLESEPGAPRPEGDVDRTPAAAPASLIVDDSSSAPLDASQMARTEFLGELRRNIEAVVDEALARTGRSTRDCPYVAYWFAFYSRQDAAHLERTAHRYAPETARATTAAELIRLLAERARRAAEVWADTGEITGVPDDVPLALPGLAASRAVPRLQRKAARGASAPSEDPAAVRARLGGGRPLDASVRGRMESAFGQSFSHVRVHDDRTGAQLSSSLGARAFTVGSHVAFAGGEYRPGTLAGDALIAHELAHVMQQHGAEDASRSTSGEAELEQDANYAAANTVAGLWTNRAGTSARAVSRLASGLAIRRCRTEPTPTACVPTLRSFAARKTGTVAMTTAWSGSCEMAFGVPGTPGITYEGQVDVPAGCAGELQYIQLLNLCVERRDLTGTYQRVKSDGWYLDGMDPYLGHTKPVTGPGTFTHTDEDSPGAGATGFDRIFMHTDRFRMWLVWKPAAPANAPRVALAVAPWYWTAKSTKTGSSGGCAADWTLSDVDAQGGTGTPTSTMPTWTKTFPGDAIAGPGRCP